MASPDQQRTESPIVLRAVLCVILTLAFVATLAPLGFGGLIRHFDQNLRLPLPGPKTAFAIFYPALGAILVFCARLKSARRFVVWYLLLSSLVLVNLAGCFVATTHM